MAQHFTIDQVRKFVRDGMRDTTQYEYAKQRGFSAQYLCDFLLGRREPGDKILNAIGFERVVTYRRKNGK